METDTEKGYKELVSLCEERISQLGLEPKRSTKDDSFSFSLNLSPDQGIGRKELIEGKAQLSKCKDKELLIALKEEFSRQMKTHEMQRLAKSSQISPISSEHFYFQSCDRLRYCHFDGQRIARELIVGSGEAKLMLTGRDDSQMCQWNLEEAKIAEELGTEITEKDFNVIWFSHGGYPYVRPTRKFRRFLSTVIKK